MADNYSNKTILRYFYNRLKVVFASATDLSTLNTKVDQIIAEGGEPNVIDIVKVNNVALTPDANKAVNIDLSGYAETSDLPTNTSDLTNNGDGQSPFATEDYVGQNGGKIQKIKVNTVEQSIDPSDKSVNITVPTKVSDITNDSGFQTANDVSGSITTALANGNDPYMTESDVDGVINQKLSSVYKFKGSVATYADLPSSGVSNGDVYDVQSTGVNYAWDATNNKWDNLGQLVDLSLYWAKSELTAMTTADIDDIMSN